MKSSDKDWEQFAKIDAYYAVATQERYRKENLDSEAIASFFESGRCQLAEVLEIVCAHLVPDFRPMRALDFGCGVGRMIIPMARVCRSVVGVDVSPSMLAEAKKNCEERGASTVVLVLGDDALTRVSGAFDFVHSHVVFQHIPTDRGERIAARLIGLLQADGVGVLHFTYSTEKSRIRRAIPWIRRRYPRLTTF